jgi:GAF domain-containing protein/HAMP domain-containing protein
MSVKVLLSLATIITIAFLSITYVNARSYQSALSDRIVIEFETLARSQASTLADILSEHLTLLRGLALVDSVRAGSEDSNAQFSADPMESESQLLAIDQQWQGATDNSMLVQSIISPRTNQLADQLVSYKTAFPEHIEFLLTNRYGGLIAASDRTSDYYQADEEWWQAAFDVGRGALYISQPFVDNRSGETVVIMAAPVYSELGEVVGIARTLLNMETIGEAVASVQFGNTGSATLIDTGRIAIADPDPEHAGTQVPISWTAPQDIQASFYSYTATDEEGAPAVLGRASFDDADIDNEDEARAIRSLGWTLFVHQTVNEAYAPIRRAVATSLLVAGIFGTLSAGLAYVVTHVVAVRPITSLAEVARRMATGDLDVRASISRGDETGDLADAFNRMATEMTQMLHILELRVRERTRGLETASEVSRATTAVLDIEELLPYVVDLVRERFDLYYVGLFLVDENERYAVLRAGTGEAGNLMLQGGHKLGVGGDSMIGQCVARDEARIALDVGEEAVRFVNPFLPDTRSEMALPLRARGQVIGAMTVQSAKSAAFDDADIAIMQTMSDQVAVAIDNASLFSQTQKALAEMRAAQKRYLVQAWTEYEETLRDATYETEALGAAPLTDVVDDAIQRSAELQDAAVHHRAEPEEPPASVVVPIALGDAVIGALGFQDEADSRIWGEDEISLVQAVADRLALAADNLRLIDTTQRQAAREQLTGELAARMRETLDVDSILQTAVRELGESLNVTEIELRMVSGDGNGA